MNPGRVIDAVAQMALRRPRMGPKRKPVAREDLRRLREARGHTLESLAHAAGVSQRTVVRIEYGEAFSLASGKKVADALGVPLSVLTGEAAKDAAPAVLDWSTFSRDILAAMKVDRLSREGEERLRFLYEAYVRQARERD